MKKILMFILAGTIWMATGCRETGKSDPDPVVSVSILPIQYFIDRLTDHQLEVNVMVPAGASHGTYAPTASQFRKLSDSGVYFRIGHLGYEQAWIGRLTEINPHMKVVDFSQHIDLIRGEEVDHGDHVHEGGIDPHIWMSPQVILSLLPKIRDAIAAVYPHLESTMEATYPVLFQEVEETHRAMMHLTTNLSQKSFMIFHPALTYLARDYNLQQIPIEHLGREPSPALLGRIIRQARQNSVGVIFIQEEYDIRNAELIAEETEAALVQINPLAYDWIREMNELMDIFQSHMQ